MNSLTVQRESQVREGENWKLSCVVGGTQGNEPLGEVSGQGEDAN